MLSRAATSLALLGRMLERSYHLARILEVHVALSLDRRDEPGPGFWNAFLELAGWPPPGSVDHRMQATELAVTAAAGPSVRRSVAAARTAAQAVRPSLPSELYEAINALHWRVQEEAWQQDLHEYLKDVQMSVHLVDALLEDGMMHDEARDFVRLGKFLERADNVVALVVRKSVELAEAPEDALEWTAVLKCCFSFESYRARYSAPVTPERVTGFLLLDPELPRSARFAVNAAQEAVRRIDERAGSRPRRLLAGLHALFGDADAERLAHRPLEFEAQYRALRRPLEEALGAAYFRPSRVASAVPTGEGGGRVPQQQQQR
ncbi:MAG TPA: alpha-E domain-containing protein [Candidatus Dormibacteraeota bacterium]